MLLLVMGLHIGFALMAAGIVGLTVVVGAFNPAMTSVVSAFYHKVSMPALVTVPLFVLMGYLASGGGISRQIYESLSLWLGRFRSGLGVATVLACTAFGTVCGSSLVTAAVFARISAPEMRRCGYDKRLAYGICASAGAIGMLIPPSILAIVYGILSGESIGKLLMAGVAPGLLLTIAFSCQIIFYYAKFRPEMLNVGGRGECKKATLKEQLASLKHWWSVVVVAVIIFGGLYGGVFSPSEGSAVAAFTLLVIYLGLGYHNRHKPRESGQTMKEELASIFTDTAVTSAMIFFVMGGATVFSNFITLTGVTAKISMFLTGSGMSNFHVVLMLMVIIGVLGCFLDSTSILCVTIPVFNPIIKSLGIDPIWYATCVIMATEIGLITPPFGLNMFATKGAAEPDVTMEDVFAGSMSFFAAMVVVLLLLLFVPEVATFLPNFVQ
jgi:C4-dicarboxylate transporter, DctM subunit